MTIPTQDAMPSNRPATLANTAAGPRAGRARRLAATTGVLITVALCVWVGRSLDASADAGLGVGRADVTTNGFTHPWLGGYLTDVGTAWCIESGQAYPRAAGNTRASDLPAERGVSATDRRALAFAVWAHGATADPTTAAGLAAVVHGLSGDDHASVDVPSMSISDPAVKAISVALYWEAQNHAFWVTDPSTDPWTITTDLTHRSGRDWDATTTVTTASGRPIADHRVGLVPYNVTDAPATEHGFTTDASGQIHSSWTQDDPGAPIVVDAQTTAPTTYLVWKGPDYPAGSIPQRIITPTGTIYRGRGQHDLPTGRIHLRKTTDNAAYQTAVGATFDVIARGVSTSVGTLTVGADGSSNVLELPIGDYVVTETTAPAGVEVDTTPYPVTVTDGDTATLQITDPVRRQAGLRLVKVDAVTGDVVAGAELLVEHDADGDGTYEDVLGTVTSALTPSSFDSLTAGDYRITEVAAPDGYELPTETVQHVSLGWDQTAAVTFADHRSVAVTTQTQLVDDVAAPTPPDALAAVAHVVAPVGAGLRDTVQVTGLAPGETGTLTATLYGPQRPDDAPVCDADSAVFTDTWSTVGSGTSTSAAFTPTSIGRYTWVASLDVPGFGTVTGPCGEVGESAVLTPTVATVAHPVDPTPGAPATDEITITGLAPTTTGTVTTALYGPFTSVEALSDACTAGEMGDPVGVVHDQVAGDPAGPTVLTSSPIAVPEGSTGGWYTFVSTLEVPGFPPIGHDCGAATETFEVTPPTTTSTTSTTAPATTTPPPPSSTTTAPTSTLPPTTTTPAPATVPPTTVTVPPTTTAPPTTSTTVLLPPTTTTSTPPTTLLPPGTTTTTTSTSTTSTTSTTAPAPTTAPRTPTPRSTPPPPVGPTTETGGGTSAVLPRTGAASARLAALGTALVLVGLAALLAVAARRNRA